MKKLLGIFGLFVFVFVFTALFDGKFLTAYNLQNLLKWTSLYAILGIGVSFVIITGGIDLSIGSVIGLVGSLLAYLINPPTINGVLAHQPWSIPAAITLCLALSLVIGLSHGLLITKMRLQPFVVTLCGLLLYRGLARFVTRDESQGFGDSVASLRAVTAGKLSVTHDFGIPAPFFYMLAIALVAGIFLNRTIWGRYLLALGRNETATRYSGVNTDQMKLLTYVICSLLAGVGGILFALELQSIQPSGLGEFYELYAIAAAVLGGCSLRGGEGTILGVLIGTAVLRLLYNSIIFLGIPTHLEFAIIGAVILAGVVADELVKRVAAKRKSS